MTGAAYNQSAKIAGVRGSFKKFEENRESFMKVMNMHRDATLEIEGEGNEILDAAVSEWDQVVNQEGFRNAQATVLAPTGTIGFMMDVGTTGVEPVIGLASQKNLSGGGRLEMKNRSFEMGLRELGYEEVEIGEIRDYVLEEDRNGRPIHPAITEATPRIKREHIPVFSTAFGDENVINYRGHIDMMAAVQPFLSGAISKTVNLPRGSDAEVVRKTYFDAWKSGLKSVAIFVDGSRDVQPISVGGNVAAEELTWGERKRLPPEIDTYKVKVNVNGTPIHLHFGEDPETDRPLEFFCSFGGSGSDYGNLADLLFKAISRSAQYGEPLEALVEDHQNVVSEVLRGFTDHKGIKSCRALMDLWSRVAAGEYLGDTSSWEVQPNPHRLRHDVLRRRRKSEAADRAIHPEYYDDAPVHLIEDTSSDKGSDGDGPVDVDGKICGRCTSIMVPNGTCFKCCNCGEDTGCG
jgi:ribonucleoside-diphosphate reductase alpha chain